MAKKAAKKPRMTAAKKAGAQKTGAKSDDIPGRIIEAALGLAAEKAWRDISLAEIAEAAALPMSQVYPVFASKRAILAGYTRRIDAAVLAGQEPDERMGSARDRLFDVLMRRFDALTPHKAALANIVYDLGRDPAGGLCGLIRLSRSMACMLEAADLSAGGPRGALRVKALSAVYLATLRTWLRDESPDLGRTMAALDRHLRRLAWLVSRCSQLRRTPAEEAPAAG